ncbi:MAG TPA: DUF3891 family protein [Acidobacteria bacterium]|nr:DUF3891 family protein [Acidobacteriota bacterium]
MFLLDEASGAPLAIAQPSHSWMAWQIARRWGNRRFTRAEPIAEVQAAVLLHDAGWDRFDARPELAPGGRPRTFDSMDTATHLAIWRESTRRAIQVSRYAGLLVAAHHRMLAGRKLDDLAGRDDREGVELTRELDREMAAIVASLEAGLAGDPRYQHVLEGPGRRANALILAAADRISVWLCAGLTFPIELPAAGRQGEELTVTVRRLGPGRLCLDPWPMEGTRVTVHCEGVRLATTRFTNPEELAGAFETAPTERLSFELLRSSVSGPSSGRSRP